MATAAVASARFGSNHDRLRLRVVVRGAVQGLGFRPYVYRLAQEMALQGWVENNSQGVFIEVEGPRPALDDFLLRLPREKPPLAFIQSLETSVLDPVGYGTFEIRASEEGGDKLALVLPDIATCDRCQAEILDSNDRRYHYPFTNCTLCGPRFSIIRALPYDRSHTTMDRFAMCRDCDTEYRQPADRRFHAQPNACPRCGPRLALLDGRGRRVGEGEAALVGAAEIIRGGQILALKGIGGFQLLVDARDDRAVRRLRRRKLREEKPLAVMFPELDALRRYAVVSPLEETLLHSPEAPIVLLRRLPRSELAPSVAPANPWLGAMLPYSPLHHLLLRELGFPVVATSGNRHDEPIVTEEAEALAALGDIADAFLVHDRPIERHVDDSVARLQLGRTLIIRRARGYAPLPVVLRDTVPPLLAVGAHLKNTVAIAKGRNVFLSQHIGDLETARAFFAFQKVIADLLRLYQVTPEAVVCDAHPDYLSTQFARSTGYPVVEVFHHHAHMAACMAENELSGPVLGVTWDGAGYGEDGTIWGGEFLLGDASSCRRVATFRPFRLPGGERAIREPRRIAFGLLCEMLGPDAAGRPWPFLRGLPDEQQAVMARMLERRLNSPVTSSCGRLFDALAAILGLKTVASFEGQAAMMVEHAADPATDRSYEVRLRDGEPLTFDWEPMMQQILRDQRQGVPAAVICASFQNTLADLIVAVARQVGVQRVALSGGCFQNNYLTTRAFRLLEAAGFRPFVHQRVPPNDGGISLGQIAVAGRRLS